MNLFTLVCDQIMVAFTNLQIGCYKTRPEENK